MGGTSPRAPGLGPSAGWASLRKAAQRRVYTALIGAQRSGIALRLLVLLALGAAALVHLLAESAAARASSRLELPLPAETALNDAASAPDDDAGGAGEPAEEDGEHTMLTDFLAAVRATHLRNGPPVAGFAQDASFCPAAIRGTAHLVLCDPSPPTGSGGGSYDACALAERAGQRVLAVSPGALHRQMARALQLLRRAPSLRVVTIVGPLRRFEAAGLPRHLAQHLPPGCVLKGVDTTGPGATVVPGGHRRPAPGGGGGGFSVVTRVRRGYEPDAHGLPVLTGPPPALLVSGTRYALSGKAHVGVVVSGDTTGEHDSAVMVRGALAAALGRASFVVRLVRARSGGGGSGGGSGGALAVHNSSSGSGSGSAAFFDEVVDLEDAADAARRLGGYDAIVCLEGWTAGHGSPGGYHALLVQAALSTGVAVLVPRSSATYEMGSMGVMAYDDVEAPRGRRAAAHDEGGEGEGEGHSGSGGGGGGGGADEDSHWLGLEDTVRMVSPSTLDDLDGHSRSAGMLRRERLRAYGDWHARAVAAWRRFLTRASDGWEDDEAEAAAAADGEDAFARDERVIVDAEDAYSAAAAATGAAAGAQRQLGGDWGPNLTALGLLTPRLRASKAVAFLVRELLPLRVGGPGTVAALLATQLLSQRVPVVIIADLEQCEDLLQWRYFAAADAGLDEEQTEALLATYCVSTLFEGALATLPALRAALSGSGAGGGGGQPRVHAHAHHGVYRDPFLQGLFRVALAVRAAYERTPFALLEAPDTGGLAFELLRPRVARAPAHAHYLPPGDTTGGWRHAGGAGAGGAEELGVRVQVRAHGVLEAAHVWDHGALAAQVARAEPARRRGVAGSHRDVARRQAALLLAERLAIQAADALVAPTRAVGEGYRHAYGLPYERIVLGPPPVARLLARDWPKPLSVTDEMDEDTEEECSDELMAFPRPCTDRRDDPACVLFLAYGSLAAVKGPDVVAAAMQLLFERAGSGGGSGGGGGGGEQGTAATAAAPAGTSPSYWAVFLGPDAPCGPSHPAAAAALAARRSGRGGGGGGLPAGRAAAALPAVGPVGVPMSGPLRASECLRASLSPAHAHRVFIESRMAARCVGACVHYARPAALVFGSLSETFHLAAHELALSGLPLVLPALPAYDGFFDARSSDGVHFYPPGDAGALAEVLARLAAARLAGDDVPGFNGTALLPRESYGDPTGPYQSTLLGARAAAVAAAGGELSVEDAVALARSDREGAPNVSGFVAGGLRELARLVRAVDAVRLPPCG